MTEYPDLFGSGPSLETPPLVKLRDVLAGAERTAAYLAGQLESAREILAAHEQEQVDRARAVPIGDVWRRLGLPVKPGELAFCPWRPEDKVPTLELGGPTEEGRRRYEESFLRQLEDKAHGQNQEGG